MNTHPLRLLGLLMTLFYVSLEEMSVRADELGRQLDRTFVWCEPVANTNDFLHAGFRREFTLETKPSVAQIHLFAYTRYRLYVNGEYVGRGPNRFESVRPEYDTWDIADRLRSGRNVVAVVVQRDWPGGVESNSGHPLSRFRRHAPGFTAQIQLLVAGQWLPVIATDNSWRGFVEVGNVSPIVRNYSSIAENYDARHWSADWTATNFDDSALPFARAVDTTDKATWPELSPRSIPHLREREVFGENSMSAGGMILTNGAIQIFSLPQIEQAYWVVDLEADAGTKLVATPMLPESSHGPASTYICRAGRQEWMGGDTFAQNALQLRVDSGRVTLRHVRLVAVNYPFDRLGAFTSSDPELNQIWALTARSLELLSEDAYTDCADRERSEWMDCDPPMYDATRVMMAGPGTNGTPVWSDPRLYANMLRRVAYSQEPDGMVRARTCSELVDIHTRMEDRACDWVEGFRKYYEATGDGELLRELWPYCERQLDWFWRHRQPDGLIRCREWIAWDNPMSYATCEGTANNAFIWRAFRDAGWVAGQIGNAAAAQKWTAAADQLRADFNRLLWDERDGAYFSAEGTPVVLPPDQRFRKSIKLAVVDGRTEPTLHANLFALDQGIVPPERRERVVAWTLAHGDQIRQVMANHYYFNLLESLDRPEYDQIVLDRIRKGWLGMVESPWQTTWEMTGSGKGKGGSHCHCYGIVPGFTLSTYVLGVRRDTPVSEHQLVVEPHLGDLTRASGTVVTEFGPVAVEWQREGAGIRFSVTIPPGVTARLALPDRGPGHTILLDQSPAQGTVVGGRRIVSLKPGVHAGSI